MLWPATQLLLLQTLLLLQDDDFAVLVGALAARMQPLHLPGRVQHHLDAVGALVVDAAAAHGLREVIDHGPGHAGQIAEVAVLPLRLQRHLVGVGVGIAVVAVVAVVRGWGWVYLYMCCVDF